MAMASAPSASAAISPWPVPKPPAAMMGSELTLRMAGISTSEVTSPPWAAASWPVTSRASTPIFSAAMACFSVTTVAMTLPP